MATLTDDQLTLIGRRASVDFQQLLQKGDLDVGKWIASQTPLAKAYLDDLRARAVADLGALDAQRINAEDRLKSTMAIIDGAIALLNT